MTDAEKALETLFAMVRLIPKPEQSGWNERLETIRIALQNAGKVDARLNTAAAQGEKVPDGMMLIRKSSMLEPDFERMVRQILDQAKQIKRLVRALENIASCNGDDVTGCAINALAEFEREGGK